jgi:hypothetical protein
MGHVQTTSMSSLHLAVTSYQYVRQSLIITKQEATDKTLKGNAWFTPKGVLNHGSSRCSHLTGVMRSCRKLEIHLPIRLSRQRPSIDDNDNPLWYWNEQTLLSLTTLKIGEEVFNILASCTRVKQTLSSVYTVIFPTQNKPQPIHCQPCYHGMISCQSSQEKLGRVWNDRFDD